jgi:hypothetical protein
MASKMHLKTATRHYLQAASGGGGAVTAAGPWPREWETFEVVPVNGEWAELQNGSSTRLRTALGHHVSVGADGSVQAPTRDAATATVFKVVMAPGQPSTVGHLSQFGLTAPNGRFVCAENGGGGELRANRTAMGPWETFEARSHPEPPHGVLTTAIRTVSGVHFLQAQNGGGSDLSARGPWPREWETFDIVAADRSSLGFPDGAKVHVRTESWHYLQAAGGGGSKVNAAGPWPREWETFTLVVPGRRPWLAPGRRFGLRSANGRFVEVEQGGGGAVLATGTALTAAATFTATDATVQPNSPARMLTGTAAREDSTVGTSFAELVPTPGQVFSTTQTCTLTCLLVTEARVSTAGAALEVRMMVDGKIANPGAAVLTTNTDYRTATHLAFLTGVQPGSHTVTVQWRVTTGRGYVRNRSFTVTEVR